MAITPLAHIADGVTLNAASPTAWLVLAGVAAFALLYFEDRWVRGQPVLPGRFSRLTGAAILVIALLAVIAPAPVNAQGEIPAGVGLPDLISDPSFIWFAQNVEDGDQNVIRVVAFDGFLHNIGDGSLDLFGNPQIDGGVKQRVFDGEDWTEVGSPTVRYETDDGHNHFHLIAAVEYSLWNEAKTAKVDEASKVGFCLIDTEVVDEVYEAFYEINRFDYCGVDDPDATELRMGITPGWRDLYDANTTLQWVDVSGTLPGRYWVGAITDPNNEIVESNEDNNGNVFSRNKFTVSGYRARPLETLPADEPIVLKADPYGAVGTRQFVIVDAPEFGTLSVPAGVDFDESTLTYTRTSRNADYEGPDSFTYYARDTESMFPLDPEIITVELDVNAGTPVEPIYQLLPIDDIELAQAPADIVVYDMVDVELDSAGSDTESRQWYAGGLPPGLSIDRETGRVTGQLTTNGTFEANIVVVSGPVTWSETMTWTVGLGEAPALAQVNDFATPANEDLRVYLGFGESGSTYEAEGLPPGTSLIPNIPLLVGLPEDIGDFPVTVNKMVDGEVVQTIEFTWTIRAAPIPAFAL